jgi:hypothetical protein
VFQTGIEGLRKIAQRSGVYAGRLGPFFRPVRVPNLEDPGWLDYWDNSTPPAVARVGVLRHDWKEPAWGVARFEAFRQEKSPTWSKMPDVMLAKCAEAAALRAAFSEETSGLYIHEEAATIEGDALPGPQAEAVAPQSSGQFAEATEEEKKERLAEITAALDAVFGKEPPWESKPKAEILKRVFRVNTWGRISQLEPAVFLRCAASFEDVLQAHREEGGES